MLFFDHHLMIKVNNIFQFYLTMSRFFPVVRDENENLLSTFLFSISILENGAMKKTINSRGRSRLLDAKFSRDISRSRIVV